MFKFITIFSFLLLVSNFCLLSNNDVPFISSERYQTSILTQDEGLLHNNIFAITQDKEGFLWFGTADGLNRYDGYDYLSFQHNLDDSATLSGNFVRALLPDSKGNLWVGTISGGVDVLNRQTNAFTSFKTSNSNRSLSNNACLSLFEDRDGNVWVGTENGINRISATTLEVTSFLVDTSDVVDFHGNGVLDLFVDSDESLWLCTRGGVYYIQNFYNKAADNNITEADKVAVIDKEVRAGVQDSNGLIWLSGVFGVSVYNPSNGALRGVLTKSESYSIISGSDSTLWVGCGANLYKVNINTFNFEKHPDVAVINSAGSQIRHLYKDHSGVLWLSLRGTGLLKINALKPFGYYGHKSTNGKSLGAKSVRAIAEDSKGNIWVSTSGFGLNMIDVETGEVNQLGYPDKFPFDHALALHGDDEGNIWAGIRSTGDIGLIKYNTNTKIAKRFNHTILKEKGGSNNLVRAIFEDSNGMYWLGKDNGIEVFDPKAERFLAYYGYLQSGKGLAAPSVQSGAIVEDQEGNIWVGSWGGLTKISFQESGNYNKPNYKRFYNIPDSNSLADNRVISLHLSTSNKLWIGTYGGGMACYDISKNEFTSYTVEQGLPSNVVYGILEDRGGNLWLSTNYGLSKLIIETGEFVNYYKYDGIQDNQFYWGAYFRDKNDNFYFGGINGLTVFNPEQITYDTVTPKVVFTEFSVFNRKVKVGEEVSGNIILNTDINFTESITLTHKEKIFSIGFSVLHYVNPESNLFSYKLEGFSEDWMEIESGRRFVTYTNLAPGEYVFHVRGANYNGVWTTSGRQLQIVVLPPWWKTWWFIVSGILLSVILFVLLYRLRIRNLRLQKKELQKLVGLRTKELEEKNIELETHHDRLERLVDERTKDLMVAKNRAEESDRLKTAFLANMSHEIRTPLNAIVGFSSLLASEEMEDDKKKEFNEAITNSTDDLLHLVDDIIDLSRIESDDLKVSLKSCNLNRLLLEMAPIIESLLYRYKKTESVDYKIQTSQENLRCITDSARIKQVLINLISNAIKFTEAGRIEFGYQLVPSKKEFEDYEIVIYVKDSGVGISPDIVNSVFDRFTKAHESGTKLYRGAGLGLAISKSVVNMLGGRIWVDSVVGEGSVFKFTIPYQPASIDNISVDQPLSNEKSFSQMNWEGRKILVAEDEDSNFDYLEAALTKTKVKLVRAINGIEAVDIFSAQKFDLILMDMRMPEMDGYEATRKIKQTEPDIPVVALTAYGMAEDKDKCLKAGCDAYISKPFRPDDLSTINDFLIAIG